MKRFSATVGAAFSLIEVLVAIAIAAGVLTVAVLIFQSVTSGGPRSAYGRIHVGASLAAFYGGTDTELDAYYAPSYGRAAQAEMVRNQFDDDLQRASAVYCLGRNAANTIHPTGIDVPAGFRGDSLDTPDAFRALLASAISGASSTFVSYRGASDAADATIFLLVPSDTAATLTVLSIYDIDLTPVTSPQGTYASVKRYQGASLTDYYDVFYPAGVGTVAFKPLVVCFERAARRYVVEGDTIDRLKQAAERPFYFVWWPDPAAPELEAVSTPDYDAGDPRASYAAMGGRTSLFFVVPMFPSL